MLRFRVLIAGFALVAAAVPARASISYYSSVSAFDNATMLAGLPTPTAISFNALTVGSLFSTYTNGTGDVTFTGSNTPGGSSDQSGSTLTVLSTPLAGWPSGNVLARSVQSLGANYVSGGSLILTFSTTVRAVAFYTSYSSNSDSMTITAVTASNLTDTHNVSVVPSSPFFEGITTDEAITSITITAPNSFNERIQIGGVLFSEATTMSGTPEPGPLALVGLGVAAIALIGRMRGNGAGGA